MNNIYKYLINKVIIYSIIILFVVTLLLFLLQSLKFLDLITNKGFSIFTVLYISSLTFAGIWLEVIPFAIVIAIVFTWNYLINNQELIIIQATGTSPIKIYSSIITVGLIFSIITFYLAFSLIPNSYYKYQELKVNFSKNYNIKIFEAERFVRVNENTNFYIKKINGNKLSSIFIYSYNPNTNKENFIYAEEGYIDFSNSKTTMLLDSVNIQELKSDNSINFLQLDKYIFDIDTFQNFVDYKKTSPREFNMTDLLNINEIYHINELKKYNPKGYANAIYDIKKEIIKKTTLIFFPLFLSIVGSYFFSIRQFKRSGNIKPILQTIIMGSTLKIISVISLSFNSYLILFFPLTISVIIIILMLLRIIYPPSLKRISNYKLFA